GWGSTSRWSCPSASSTSSRRRDRATWPLSRRWRASGGGGWTGMVPRCSRCWSGGDGVIIRTAGGMGPVGRSRGVLVSRMKVGKFEILTELGKGSMGTVYKARDPVLDRLVALKTVAPGLLADHIAVERFQREARAAARLQHPSIVTIFDSAEADGTVYIAMELLEGMDLARALVPPDRMTLAEKLKIVVDVCRGLDYAHKQGTIHRDVKPANIRVRPDGWVKIVDFGIARSIDSSTLTATGLVLGTPSYMAPEVLEGHGSDHRADMWAVGIILYEILTGRRPFEAETI